MGRPINGGLGYVAQDLTVVETFIASEAIVKGDVVMFDLTNKSLYHCSQSDANGIPIGVAQEAAAASGDHIKVQTYGIGIKAITTGGSANVGAALVCGAAGASAEVAGGTEPTNRPLGWAFALDTSTALAAGDYVITCGPILR